MRLCHPYDLVIPTTDATVAPAQLLRLESLSIPLYALAGCLGTLGTAASIGCATGTLGTLGTIGTYNPWHKVPSESDDWSED